MRLYASLAGWCEWTNQEELARITQHQVVQKISYLTASSP
jgi:hypothetical protein